MAENSPSKILVKSSKGYRTREFILNRSAHLFNQQGYAGASMSDIMRETGMEKGGIYNHFKSKDDLALSAFDYAFGLVSERMGEAIKPKKDAGERLIAIVEVFRTYVDDPVLQGGCPVLNTAIESDDSHPALHERVRSAMDSWIALIERTVAKGIERGQIRPDVDGSELATVMISTLEGAMMLSKLYGESIHMHRAVDHMTRYIRQSVITMPTEN